jgi:6-phosphogluconolactonase
VLAISDGAWTPVQTVTSANPSFLAVHPSQRFLYAINEIDSYQGLPTGTAEAYAIDARDGRLTLLNRQPLSLSGVVPAHLAVSPDGRALAVALYGGGAYNVLPIEPDGKLGKVSGIEKETGSGPDAERQESPHPHMMLFDASGRYLLGTDLGTDRINVFTLAEGKLALHGRTSVSPGSGPRHLALHLSQRFVYLVSELDATVACARHSRTPAPRPGSRRAAGRRWRCRRWSRGRTPPRRPWRRRAAGRGRRCAGCAPTCRSSCARPFQREQRRSRQ